MRALWLASGAVLDGPLAEPGGVWAQSTAFLGLRHRRGDGFWLGSIAL